jgi:glycosyltransferase involved in cell wall biosynthesis
MLGREDYQFPGSRQLLTLAPLPPDIVHVHNLHGDFFDLPYLPALSREVPVVMTLHDAWLLAGHCAHSFACERWKSGCGRCPDLDVPLAIARDNTAANWRRKRAILSNSHLYVATPSQWLMDKVEQSPLWVGARERRVIPNGVDLSEFRPADRAAARGILDLEQDARVLLFAAHGIKGNVWKDYHALRLAVAQVAQRYDNVVFIGLGEEAPPERIGRAWVRFVPPVSDAASIPRYYQAANLYIHAARADTFPTTVIEALACGTPVVATGVGGIPEQIKGLRTECDLDWFEGRHLNRFGPDQATGILTQPSDAAALAQGVAYLLGNRALREQLGRNAALDAAQRFDLEVQASQYLSWYQQIIDARQNRTALP